MNVWITELMKILRILAGNPAQTVELAVVLALATITFVFMLSKIGNLFGANVTSALRSGMIFIIGAAVLLGGVCAIQIYGAAKLTTATLRLWVPIGTAILLLLAVASPLTCFIHKTKYLSALFSLILALASAAVISALVGASFDAVFSGNKQLDGARQKKAAAEEAMK